MAWTADTSVAIAALVAGHVAHEAANHRLSRSPAVLVDHALLECYSVLTRTPAFALADADAARVLAGAFPGGVLSLPTRRRAALPALLARQGIRGGAVYDALIAATALHHGVGLLSLDRRAARTYSALGARFELLDG